MLPIIAKLSGILKSEYANISNFLLLLGRELKGIRILPKGNIICDALRDLVPFTQFTTICDLVRFSIICAI